MIIFRTALSQIGVLLALIISFPLAAEQVYQWVDEDGVTHFSQWAPDNTVDGLSKIVLTDTTPANYDPEEDRYSIKALADQIESMRAQIEQKREEHRRRQSETNQQTIVQYQNYDSNYGTSAWYPPPLHRPPDIPERPEPPTAQPPSYPFRPPGN